MQSLTQPPRDGAPAALALSLSWEGHRVRMVGTAERPLWVAKDACRVLGLHGPSNVARDVPEGERGFVNLTTPGGPQPAYPQAGGPATGGDVAGRS